MKNNKICKKRSKLNCRDCKNYYWGSCLRHRDINELFTKCKEFKIRDNVVIKEDKIIKRKINKVNKVFTPNGIEYREIRAETRHKKEL